MYKKFYSKFLQANEGVKHYAAHSHHYWPDVTYDAMIDYWNDSARLVDNKWDYILGTKVPETQKLISKNLNLKYSENICFAPNTHDFIARLFSCFELNPNKKIKLLTTDSEFHSFSRQFHRLVELGYVEATVVPTQPFADFPDRFKQQISTKPFDLIFFSHVFFNSGYAVSNLNDVVKAVTNPETMIVIDGYHSFMAVPTDLSEIEDRAFYLAGSYKYAQGGEGCCFMSIPQSFKPNPALTGWFAGFASLDNLKDITKFSTDGYRFAGSTMDYTALYRLNAVLKLYQENNITVKEIHTYIQQLQAEFLKYIDSKSHPEINRSRLLSFDINHQHGHFFSFQCSSVEACQIVKKSLAANKIITDSRGSLLRFGFAPYHDLNIDLGF